MLQTRRSSQKIQLCSQTTAMLRKWMQRDRDEKCAKTDKNLQRFTTPTAPTSRATELFPAFSNVEVLQAEFAHGSRNVAQCQRFSTMRHCGAFYIVSKIFQIEASILARVSILHSIRAHSRLTTKLLRTIDYQSHELCAMKKLQKCIGGSETRLRRS